jgi:hypothetical protein
LIHIISLDHHWINRPNCLKTNGVDRRKEYEAAEGEWALYWASLVGWSHCGAQLAHASAWYLLEPSRVVFRSFRGLNHLLSSVCLFRVYDSGPGAVF